MPTMTSLLAWHLLDPGPIQAKVVQLILLAGIDGCIHSDIKRVFPPDAADGSVNTRYTELERKSLIFRMEDMRVGHRSREQIVWRHFSFAAGLGVTLPTAPPATGLKPFATRLGRAARAAKTLDELKKFIIDEIRPILAKSKKTHKGSTRPKKGKSP